MREGGTGTLSESEEQPEQLPGKYEAETRGIPHYIIDLTGAFILKDDLDTFAWNNITF